MKSPAISTYFLLSAIKKEGVGEFLLKYYPDVIRRVFSYSVKEASTVESRIKIIIINWINEYGSIPKLPDTVLSKLGSRRQIFVCTNRK